MGTAGSLIPIEPQAIQGVTNSEFSMIQELFRNVDANTASQTTGGSVERGNPTATQINAIQQQAAIMSDLTEITSTLLEKKLVMLRLLNILNY